MIIHLLYGPLEYFNSRALVSPFIRYRRFLRDAGVRLQLFSNISSTLCDCDWLLIDSKIYRDQWVASGSQALEEIAQLAQQVDRIAWFNTGDSSGGIQKVVVDLVDVYFKNQLLRNRTLYTKKFYGGRIYTDYYFEKYGIIDKNEFPSSGLSDTQIAKLRLSWNLGLNPSLSFASNLKSRMAVNPTLLGLMSHPMEKKGICNRGFKKKTKQIQCRFNTKYERPTIAFQRKELKRLVRSLGISTEPVSRRRYYDELGKSNFAISPFGWGEVCIRDFEAVIVGTILIKPDMSHIETWPDIYVEGETYIAHSWDLEHARDLIVDVLQTPEKYDGFAQNALERFNEAFDVEHGHGFVRHLLEMLRNP